MDTASSGETHDYIKCETCHFDIQKEDFEKFVCIECQSKCCWACADDQGYTKNEHVNDYKCIHCTFKETIREAEEAGVIKVRYF
jgi:hypothetical protein